MGTWRNNAINLAKTPIVGWTRGQGAVGAFIEMYPSISIPQHIGRHYCTGDNVVGPHTGINEGGSSTRRKLHTWTNDRRCWTWGRWSEFTSGKRSRILTPMALLAAPIEVMLSRTSRPDKISGGGGQCPRAPRNQKSRQPLLLCEQRFWW